MIAPALILAGLAAATLTLALARREVAATAGRGRVDRPFGDAIAVLMAWIALAGLVTAGLYRFGVLPTAAATALFVALGRLAPQGWDRAAPWKLHLSVLSVFLSIAALLGVVSMMEGALLDV